MRSSRGLARGLSPTARAGPPGAPRLRPKGAPDAIKYEVFEPPGASDIAKLTFFDARAPQIW